MRKDCSAFALPITAMFSPLCTSPHRPIPVCCTCLTAGLQELLSKGGDFLVEEGRLARANEFLKAMADPTTANFGVLLSGPNGIGEQCGGVLWIDCGCAAVQLSHSRFPLRCAIRC